MDSVAGKVVAFEASVDARVREQVEAHTQARDAERDIEVARIRQELTSARIAAEQLGGELCEKELALHEAVEARQQADVRFAAAQESVRELAEVRAAFEAFQKASQDKVRVVF
jgi:hypothetical protein